MKRVDGFGQLESMCHEGFQVDQPGGNKSDGFGVLADALVANLYSTHTIISRGFGLTWLA